MPVHWSPAARTALAEAELEYNDKHVSTSVYVKFKLSNKPPDILKHTGSKEVFLVIWTTTPWTLPVNMAVCYLSNMQYSVVRLENSEDCYLVSTEFVNKLETMTGLRATTILTLKGSDLHCATYSHPLKSDDVHLPLLESDHVTAEKGTGLVHTAPAHGTDDFQIAIKHGLSLECHVDEAGLYTDQVDSRLTGKHVLKDGNIAVLSLMSDNIIHQEDFTHNYPYDWRTHKPCIYRASKQWFVDTGKIKQQALECLDNVLIHPAKWSQVIRDKVNTRTYWCISRQRSWGVPIPVFYNKNTKEVLCNSDSIGHIRKLVARHGTDCWWTLPIDELLPPEIKKKSGFEADDEFEKCKDVLDIWFDSGSTWAYALKDVGNCSDLYMEGHDQLTGWFQTSLLTSSALQAKAPYKQLVVHGFVVDENGNKMSKSKGNVINPQIVVDGGKNKNKHPAYGADVLRLWVARSSLDSTVKIGPKTLESCKEQLFSIRKLFRYLLGNLQDFDLVDDVVDYSDLWLTDKYMLNQLYQLIQQANLHYDDFRFDSVLRLCDKFLVTDVSAFYCTSTKDRMYCSHADDSGRRSAQTVQFYVLESLMKILAPIVPHLCEELHLHHPFTSRGVDSFFKANLITADPAWSDSSWKNTLDTAFTIRSLFRNAIDSVLPVNFHVVIFANTKLLAQLQLLQAEKESHYSALCELLQASTTSLALHTPDQLPDDMQIIQGSCDLHTADGQENAEFLLGVRQSETFICERCKRYTALKYGTPCTRCMEILSTGWD